jgi:hypothetical protein
MADGRAELLADRYLAALLAAPPLFLAGIGCWLTGWLTPRLVKRLGDVARVRRGLGAVGCALACLMLLLSAQLKHPVLAIVAMAGIRQSMARARVPRGLEGAGITLIIAGTMALAFMGFNGMM